MKHDTAGLIERTAKAFVESYKVGGGADWLNSLPVKKRRQELVGMKLWYIKEYVFYIHRALSDEDRAWFFQQKSSYKCTLRWKIFIQAAHYISKGR